MGFAARYTSARRGYGGRREDIAVVGVLWLGMSVAARAFLGPALVYPPIMVFMVRGVYGDAPDGCAAGGRRHDTAGHGAPYARSGRQRAARPRVCAAGW